MHRDQFEDMSEIPVQHIDWYVIPTEMAPAGEQGDIKFFDKTLNKS